MRSTLQKRTESSRCAEPDPDLFINPRRTAALIDVAIDPPLFHVGKVREGPVGNTDDEDESDRAEGTDFPLTHWSLIQRAGEGRSFSRETLDVILQRYLPALKAHLLSRGIPAQRVDDYVQGFIENRVLEGNLLASADRQRGRFRSFLLASLNNYVANMYRAERAAKRSPASGAPLSLDPEAGIDAPDPTAAALGSPGTCDAFDVAWAREALAEALRRTQNNFRASGRDDLWDVFNSRIVKPTLEDAEPIAYAELVRRHGYTTWKQAANALITAKRRFEQALREVLREHVDEHEVDAELVSLGQALASERRRP